MRALDFSFDGICTKYRQLDTCTQDLHRTDVYFLCIQFVPCSRHAFCSSGWLADQTDVRKELSESQELTIVQRLD